MGPAAREALKEQGNNNLAELSCKKENGFAQVDFKGSGSFVRKCRTLNLKAVALHAVGSKIGGPLSNAEQNSSSR